MKNFKIDSRKIKKGDIFIAIKGSEYDGHKFVDNAFLKGASSCIVEKNIKRSKGKIKVVKDTKAEYSKMSANYFSNPSKKIKNIGLTGTNGKTTISFLVNEILTQAKIKTGLIGTIFYKSSKKIKPADRTTPDAYILNSLLREMVDNKFSHCIMEVSSHALEQKRTSDIFYDLAVFTNLTAEHLDYHKNMNEYFKAKKLIFNNLKKKAKAIVNIDDKRGKILKETFKAKALGYSIKTKTDVYAKDIAMDIKGSTFDVVTSKWKITINTSLIGEYNISNIVCAAAIAFSLGIKKEVIAKSLSKAKAPNGRLQRIKTLKTNVFIDYAHTSDALDNLLKTVYKVKTKDLITVMGCGGDRDKTKRAKMGKTAQKFSDSLIITSDNPRTEKPIDIINDILKGVNKRKKNYEIIPDRKKSYN